MTTINYISGEIVLSITEQGAPGVSGAIVQAVAGVALDAFKAVWLDSELEKVYYADKDSIPSVNGFLGITTKAAALNATAYIATLNTLENPDWEWDIEGDMRLFLDNDGGLIQGAPNSAAAFLHVGMVLSATKIFIRISEPILIT